jgi:hypothetical protein
MSPRRLSLVFTLTVLVAQTGCKEDEFEQGSKIGGNELHAYDSWSCNEQKIVGPFMIETFLDSNRNANARVSYSIQRHQVSPGLSGMQPAPASIEIHLDSVAGGRWSVTWLELMGLLRMLDSEYAANELPYPIHEITMQCGPTVTMISDPSRGSSMNTRFMGDSPSGQDCVDALRQSGWFRFKFNDPAKHKQYLKVEGRADFAGAMREAVYMAGQGFRRAKLGECQLARPPQPIGEPW